MQLKTIEQVIKSKLIEWLGTINDFELRERVKDSILLSGGSIASMLLNQDVNDYDIYIKDVNVLRDITAYYTKGHKAIKVLWGGDKESLMALDFSDKETSYSIAIQNLKSDQLKLYFGGSLCYKIEKPTYKKYVPVFFSPNAISLSDNIQIVLRFHGDNEQIHKTFDFIHATNYFTFKDGLVTNIKALESLLTKQLIYQGSLYPLTSIIRMKKFIKRGWNINAGEILKIMFQISELDLKEPSTLEEQLIGVDVAYFSILIEILRGVDKKTITSVFLNTVIDRVFNSSNEEI
jgi:hypothetical protein